MEQKELKLILAEALSLGQILLKFLLNKRKPQRLAVKMEKSKKSIQVLIMVWAFV